MMRPPFPSNRGGHGQRPGQGAVRISQLEKTLASFDREIGAKLTVVLTQFHTKYVRPLEERIAYLEAPPHQKVWYQLGRLWAWVRSFVHVERTDQKPEQAGGQMAEPAAAPPSEEVAKHMAEVGGQPAKLLDASGDPVQSEKRDD